MSQTLTAQELSWNCTGSRVAETINDKTVNCEVDGADDAQYFLVFVNTNDGVGSHYSGSIKAGDSWMSGQGEKKFDIATAESTFSHAFGPFESARFERSDETLQVSFSSAITNIMGKLLKVPK